MKKKGIVIGLFILAAVGLGAGIFFYISKKNPGAQTDMPPMPPQVRERENVVAATGVTTAGLIEKELNFDFLDTDLVVDEVYVSSSQEVEKGAKVLKITDSSLREAVRELERAQMDASLAYRQGVIDYETGKMDAENVRKNSQIEAEQAQTGYDNAIAKAEAEVEKAEQEVQDAQELVEEYTDAIENDYYYTEYEVAEKKEAYEKNVALFFDKLDDYEYELDDDDDDDPNTFQIVKKDGKDSRGDTDGEITVLQLLKSEYQENKEEYDKAVEDYEAATEKAKAGIAAATDALQAKQLALQEAQIALEKTKTEAQAEYDLAVIKGEKAQTVYETEERRLQEALDTLADEEEEAAENYELFMETLGDGYIYTESDGTILMIRASANTELPDEGVLLAYSDDDTIRVTASVDQSDIGRITVGEKAAVVVDEQNIYTGIVIQIDPVSASAGRSAVSYSVVLELEGDISGLEANMTAVVYFGMTGEEYKQ